MCVCLFAGLVVRVFVCVGCVCVGCLCLIGACVCDSVLVACVVD